MLLVSDANIFIDLETAGLTAELFRLPHEIVVPDILYARELADRYVHLRELGLQVRRLTGLQVSDAYQLRQKHRALSMNDLFALTLAKDLSCPLITDNRRLRAASTREGLQFLGTLTLIRTTPVCLRASRPTRDEMRTSE